jgi:hypothetical protein
MVPSSKRVGALAVLCGVIVLSWSGCSDPVEVCPPGKTDYCPCPGASPPGTQTCSADGFGWSGCECSDGHGSTSSSSGMTSSSSSSMAITSSSSGGPGGAGGASSSGSSSGTGTDGGGGDGGACVPKTCHELNAQGDCANVMSCGNMLDCSGICGNPMYITCNMGACTCMDALVPEAFCNKYPGYKTKWCGWPAPGAPPGCIALGPGSISWCCPP